MIYNIYASVLRYGNFQSSAGEKLYFTALSCLGIDVAPRENEFGCAEAVNNIVYKAFKDYAGGDLSTYRMYHSIRNNKKFIRVTKPLRGDIILSPTGYGGQNGIKNGHTGIMGISDKIMSNDSVTGLFFENYTLRTWADRYKRKGGYPVYFYRRISF